MSTMRRGRLIWSNQILPLRGYVTLFSSLNSCFSTLHSEAQRGKSKHGLRLTPLPASLPGRYSFLKAYKRSLSDGRHCSAACTEEPFTGESIPVIFLKEILKSSSPLSVYEKSTISTVVTAKNIERVGVCILHWWCCSCSVSSGNRNGGTLYLRVTCDYLHHGSGVKVAFRQTGRRARDRQTDEHPDSMHMITHTSFTAITRTHIWI